MYGPWALVNTRKQELQKDGVKRMLLDMIMIMKQSDGLENHCKLFLRGVLSVEYKYQIL